jgi:hypothetical protein
VAGGGGDGRGGEHLAIGGGAPSGVEVALWPTFVANTDQPRDTQAVFAAVSALSAGASTLPLAERWDALSGATGSPRTVTWSRLDAMTKPFRDRDDDVALCIGIVDRDVPAWPFAESLDTDAARSAIERTIDEAYTRYAPRLSHLCFGYELDRYLIGATKAESQQLLQLLKHAVDYARLHPQRNEKTSIGAAITLAALTNATDAPFEQLTLGDEVVAVYDPLDDTASLKPPESIGAEVAAALATLESLGGPPLPLTLFEVGYPSSADVGSSEKAQRLFFEALFGVLDEHRDAVSFVGVFGLGDRAAADCEAEAVTFGGSATAQAKRALARCSMGLRAETDKLALQTVLSGISAYR